MDQRIQEYAGSPHYTVLYQEDGVYVDRGLLSDEGAPSPPLIVYDLMRRGIEGLSASVLLSKMRRGETPLKAAEPQEAKAADACAFVVVEKGALSATMVLLPPVNGGAPATVEALLTQCNKEYGVVAGLDEALLTRMVDQERYYVPFEIASGVAPVNGKDGYLDYRFRTEHTYSPRVLPDGSVDYKDLDLFASVEKGAVLVVAVPPEEGAPGFTVRGECLSAKRGRHVRLPKGRNVSVSDDGTSLVADKDGRIDLIRGRVEISDVYEIRGDADMGVGNIDFTGDLLIHGNVIPNLTLRATGSIEIYGTVDVSTITAGKNIILHKGIQGADKAVLQAGGDVIARFIERATVAAGGSVHSDYIVHSYVTAQESIVLKGKHGRLIGGTLRAGKEIIARTIGSSAGDDTTLELGLEPRLRTRMQALTAKRTQLLAQLEKIDSIAKVLPSAETDPARLEMWQKLLAGRGPLQEEYDDALQEYEAAKARLSHLSGSMAHVYGCIYPDVKITIDSAVYITRSMIDFATFKCQGGDVVFSACEVNLR